MGRDPERDLEMMIGGRYLYAEGVVYEGGHLQARQESQGVCMQVG